MPHPTATARAEGRACAASLFKLADDSGAIERLLHAIYTLGDSTLHGGQSALSAQRGASEALQSRGVGAVTSHLSAAPEAVGSGLKAFYDRGGLRAAGTLAGVGLGAYGAHQLYKQHVEPRLSHDNGGAEGLGIPHGYGSEFR